MTGNPGHHKAQHLIEHEAYRRIMAGEAPQSLDLFAQQLLDWFHTTYPDAVPTTLELVERDIRDTWHRRHDLIRGG